jgi:hypothetical protein
MTIQLQNRDLIIFREIDSCRFLTLKQIATLCFNNKAEAAKKRLQKLQQGGFLKRHSSGILYPSIYMLKNTARILIGERGTEKKWVPSVNTLNHEITVRDFRASVIRDVSHQGMEIPVFTLNPADLSFSIGTNSLRSDGYFEIKTNDQLSKYFFEVDMGTETHSNIKTRVNLYRKLANSRIFKISGKERNKPSRLVSFKVLFLLPSDIRLQSFLHKLYLDGVRDFILAGNLSQIIQNPLSLVWFRPRYIQKRLAAAGTYSKKPPETIAPEGI